MLRIRILLPLVVLALATAAMVFASLEASDALSRRQRAESFLVVNRISELLIKSAGSWAVERGQSNSALSAAGAADAGRREAIAQARSEGDAAFQQAIALLADVPEMKAAGAALATAMGAFDDHRSRRAAVDQAIARPAAERDGAVVRSTFAAITGTIDTAATTLRQIMETLTDTPSAALSRMVAMRHFGAVMAENAGRERGYLGGLVSAKKPMSPDNIRDLAGFRGQIELAWPMIATLKQRADTPADVATAIAAVDAEYFDAYGKLRADMLAAGGSGNYALSGPDYFARATGGVAAILKLAGAIGTAADREAAGDAARSTSRLVMALAALGFAVALVLASLWITFVRILRPLAELGGALRKLAVGQIDMVLPGLDRHDEIGEMAHAIDACKAHAVAKSRAEIEARVEQEALAVAQRRADMHKLADHFEGAIGDIVEAVSSAATELEASAGTLSDHAAFSQQLSEKVADASEEASTNVQSVASASEEMTASVEEISRQVQLSARIASDAVEQAGRTNRRVEELSSAAARIGDVVELINSIAGQTNLLALNATIEAARAGEAGRGFAVVAAEVKALAEQTAKATGDIGQQIASIQAATHESVGAIKEISDIIGKMSEISSTIASAVEQQGAATREISRNIQNAAGGTRAVSSNIAEVEHGATGTGAAAGEVLTAAQALAGESNRLKLEVGKFLYSVRAA